MWVPESDPSRLGGLIGELEQLATAAQAAAGLVPEWVPRPMLPWEVASQVNFVALDRVMTRGYASTQHLLSGYHTVLMQDLTAALGLPDVNDPREVAAAVAEWAATDGGQQSSAAYSNAVNQMLQVLVETANSAGEEVAREALMQGVPVDPMPAVGDLALKRNRRMFRAEAQLPVQTLRANVMRAVTAAGQRPQSVDAVLMAGGNVSLKSAEDTARQSVHIAHGEGRDAAAARLPVPKAIYSSEILDRDVCAPCSRVDGTLYATMAAALVDYPAAGAYRECDGGQRCRGSLVYIWPQETGQFKFNPSQPRDSIGRWGGGGFGRITVKGRPHGAGTLADPVQVNGDLTLAVELLGQGKHVRLSQPDEVATVMTKLTAAVEDARAHGRAAPNYNLCHLSVPGTNLFCADSKQVPRAQMPQLSGFAREGSPAWADRDSRGKVNAGPAFQQALIDQGISVQSTTVLASHLRASQSELDGPKVAGMYTAMEAGKITERPIFVTSDGYIVDGHHRWAAKVALDTRNNRLGDVSMPVTMIDLDIGATLDFANQFTADYGIRSKGLGAGSEALAAARARAALRRAFEERLRFDPSQARDGKGKWSAAGGGFDPAPFHTATTVGQVGDAEAAKPRSLPKPIVRQEPNPIPTSWASADDELGAVNQPRDHIGRWTSGGGGMAVREMSGLPPALQGKIVGKLTTLTGLSETELSARVQNNLDSLYAASGGTHGDFYETEGTDIAARADTIRAEHPGSTVNAERLTGMVAVTSALMPWVQNKDLAEGIARKLAADEAFDVTPETIADYNSWVGGRRPGAAKAHPELVPGRYRPSELPADFVASTTPGMPRTLNGDAVVRAAQIYRGDLSLDAAIQGPKQRSFTNNLLAPDDPRFVTVDTWHYRAMLDGVPIAGKLGGASYNYTLDQWADLELTTTDGRAASYGFDATKDRYDPVNMAAAKKAIRSPQTLLQGSPSSAKDDWHYGTYPWFVEQTQVAAQRQGVSPAAMQATVWYEAGGGR